MFTYDPQMNVFQILQVYLLLLHQTIAHEPHRHRKPEHLIMFAQALPRQSDVKIDHSPHFLQRQPVSLQCGGVVHVPVERLLRVIPQR